MRLPVTVIILAQNEELNIAYALKSVISGFSQVIVIDSSSKDKTLEICRNHNEVKIYNHGFENWAKQRNWALDNCNIDNPVVFFLDADEYITPEFIAELRALLETDLNFDAILLSPVYVFQGKRLTYAYGHPNIRRIFKKTWPRFVCEGARERAISGEDTRRMRSPLIHHDRKGISAWIIKHAKNAEREAEFYRISGTDQEYPADLKRRTWARKKIWDRLPLLVRPFLYFLYRYIGRLGFLDGKAGLVYCFLHAFWYQLLIDLIIIEKRLVTK